MPTAPLAYCASPGCRNRVISGYCPQHAQVNPSGPKRTDDPAQIAANRFRDSAAWKRLRTVMAAQNPLCCDPFRDPNHPKVTEDIHHIEPVAVRPDLATEATNLAPLCHACHRSVEAMVRRGEPTAHLFVGKTCQPICFVC